MDGRVLFCLVASVWFLHSSEQVARPFPNEREFFAAAQENVTRSEREQFRFAFKERRTELHMNPFGRIGTGETRAYEVTPMDNGAVILRRLIERDGKAVSGAPVQREELRQRSGRQERKSGIEDTVDVLSFVMDRRETVHGRDAIVVRFEPKPNARPQTREGRLARVFKGSIWVDEAAREVTRVEATAIDDISYGFGLVARLNRGTTVTLKRDRIEGTTWLPTSIRFIGQGRALVFRRLNIDHAVEWFDYRRVGD